MRLLITVRIRMKSEEAGGRHASFTEGYCPHLVVSGHSEWLPVRATHCPGPVAPGDEAEVVFAWMNGSALDHSALQADATFEVMEGPRMVGNGCIIEKRFEV